MSFSSEVKAELAKQIGNARHCQLAELSAFLFFGGTYSEENVLCFSTEHVPSAEAYFLLLKKLFRIIPALHIEKRAKTKRSSILVEDQEDTVRILQGCGFLHAAAEDRSWDALRAGFFAGPVKNNPVLQKECCRRAFLKGAFLAVGSISDPRRSYHCEFVCEEDNTAEALLFLLRETGIECGKTARKKYIVVYIKDSDALCRLLGLMGARLALMEFENTRILKEMRENVNRKVNCETANIHKTVSAALRQKEDILLIEKEIGLERLPNGLDEIARLRLQYPEIPLKELGIILNPPLGKSGVNHRLRKISKIAENLRKTEDF